MVNLKYGLNLEKAWKFRPTFNLTNQGEYGSKKIEEKLSRQIVL